MRAHASLTQPYTAYGNHEGSITVSYSLKNLRMHSAHARTPQGKWPTSSKGGSARSPQHMGFRENGESCKVLNSVINSVHISQRIITRRQPTTVPHIYYTFLQCTEIFRDKYIIHGVYTAVHTYTQQLRQLLKREYCCI